MRSTDIQFQQSFTIVTETCCACGVLFGMERGYRQKRIDDHQMFFCPNGHEQSYTGKTAAQKLADALETTRKAEARALAAEAERKVVENSLKVTQAKLTRQTKRVNHGVCPHCNRQFKQLLRHMEHQHSAQLKAKLKKDEK